MRLFGSPMLLYIQLIFPICLARQGQRRQGGWTYGTGSVNLTDPTACWVINNTSGKFSQKIRDVLVPGVQ